MGIILFQSDEGTVGLFTATGIMSDSDQGILAGINAAGTGAIMDYSFEFRRLGAEDHRLYVTKLGTGDHQTAQVIMPLQSQLTQIQDHSGSIEGVLQLLTVLTRGNPTGGHISIPSGLVEEAQGAVGLLNQVSDSIRQHFTSVQTLSGDPAASLQSLRLKIEELGAAAGIQSISHLIGDLATRMVDGHEVSFVDGYVDWDIFIDGASVKKSLVRGALEMDEGGVHSSLELTLRGDHAFQTADPSLLIGQSRIEVQVGTRVAYFLMEERNGTEGEFTVWGRSLTAQEDAPFQPETSFHLDSPTRASDLAATLAGSRALDWECVDWMVPVGFQYTGTPVDGIMELARAVGAVLRSQDDGSFRVRRLHPVRPVKMAATAPAVEYDRFTNLMQLSYRELKGKGYNRIEVQGHTSEVQLPQLNVEESSPVRKQDCHVRAYWPSTPPEGVETYLTAGIASLAGRGTERIEETVTFSEGQASAQFPVEELEYFSWIGTSGGAISCTKGSPVLTIETTDPVIAVVTYKANYQRYRLSNHDVERLLMTLSVPADLDISVRVKMGESDKEAPGLTSNILTDNAAAIEKGVAWLDSNKYDRTEASIQAPYKDAAIDGATVSINDERVSLLGNARIRRAVIAFEPSKVAQMLEVEQCQVS